MNETLRNSFYYRESSVQRLSILKLADSRATLGYRHQRSLSLLELFVQSGGAKHPLAILEAHTLMAHNNDVDPGVLTPWHYGMLTHVTLIAQLVYPFLI